MIGGDTFTYLDRIVEVSLRVVANDAGWIQVTMAKPDDVNRTLAVRIRDAELDRFVDAVLAARSAALSQPSNEGDNHDAG